MTGETKAYSKASRKKEKSMQDTVKIFSSCASLMIQCLNDAGIVDGQSAFEHHFDNSKGMGLMPDDMKVIRKTMSDYGFIMQGRRLEGGGIEMVFSELGDIGVPTTIFIDMVSCYNKGGYMLAFRYDGKECRLLCSDAQSKQFMDHKVKHVWMRWDDGIDRSPCARKIGNRQPAAEEKRRWKDTEYYCYFQPNPCGNNIGDCVVRGISKVMDITWNEALERLSSIGSVTINSRAVYSQFLRREGFVRYKPMIKDGYKLNGKAFCDEMNKRYHNGERILAKVGKCHIAAIVADSSDSKYKIFDSWDSSERTIGEYWVKFVEKPKEISLVEGGDRRAFGDTGLLQ